MESSRLMVRGGKEGRVGGFFFQMWVGELQKKRV
jgi:hypothetical protein